MPGLVAGASLFVYPSLYEGFGFPVVQAMAANVPVLSSRTSCLPEIAGDAAAYVDPRSRLRNGGTVDPAAGIAGGAVQARANGSRAGGMLSLGAVRAGIARVLPGDRRLLTFKVPG